MLNFLLLNLTNDYYTNLFISLKYGHELLPLASLIFLFGLIGFIESQEFISVLINTEIMMLGANFHLITSSIIWGDYYGQVYALCFLAVTAAETVVGLGLVVLLYRTKGKISFDEFSTLRG